MLIIMYFSVAAGSTVETQIPLNPPFPKGDFLDPFEKGGRGISSPGSGAFHFMEFSPRYCLQPLAQVKLTKSR